MWEPAAALAKLTPGCGPAINGKVPLKFGEAEAVMYQPFPAHLVRLLPSQRWLLSLDEAITVTHLAVQARR